MQVSVENVGKLERKLTVKIPAEQFESQVQSRMQELSRSVRLKGFRPGKVPSKVIEQRFGAQVRGEALSELVRTTLGDAIEQEKLRPAVQPQISTTGVPANGELEYVATFEVIPEIGKIDVSSLPITRVSAEVTDGDVDTMIDTLRQQRRSWNQVERPAQAGDMVLFEYSAKAGDYRYPAEGVDRVGTIIGSNALFAELEGKLVGLKADETKTVDVTFPADFRNPELAGKAATLDLKIVRVQEPQLPALDEAFFESFGIRDGGLEKFRADVRANLERELKGTLLQRLKSEVVEKLVGAHAALDLPQGMIDGEAQALAQQATDQARRAGQKDVTVSPEPYTEIARRRVAAGLLLTEVARQNELRVDSKRVAETLATIASTYEEPEQVIELYKRDPQLMQGLHNRVLEDQVAEWIAAHAAVTESKQTFAEVMRPQG